MTTTMGKEAENDEVEVEVPEKEVRSGLDMFFHLLTFFPPPLLGAVDCWCILIKERELVNNLLLFLSSFFTLVG